MDFSVVQLPANNNNALNPGQVMQNNLFNQSGNNQVINVIVPTKLLQNAMNNSGDNFFNDSLGNNWRDYDDDGMNGDPITSGLNSSSPFIRNFFRNINNNNNSAFDWGNSGNSSSRTRRAKRQLKALLNELLRMCSRNNVSF